MSGKNEKVAAIVAAFQGREVDACYLGYFDCFNRHLFFEAHEVLEQLWLPQRRGPDGNFYKGLIQLAGGFVHVQKGRFSPAAALFKLARKNLEPYPDVHQGMRLVPLRGLLADWVRRLETGPGGERRFSVADAPRLALVTG